MQWRNISDQPQTVTFPSGQDFDITVRRQSGEQVWQWSASRTFIQVLREVMLQPGEQRTFTATWNPAQESGTAAGPGVYEATAVLTTRNPIESNAVRFVLQR